VSAVAHAVSRVLGQQCPHHLEESSK